MLSSVSSISFRGDSVKNSDLLSSPGKFSSSQVSMVSKPDTFEFPDEENENSTAKVLGSIIGLAALAWIGLGIAVGKKGSKWQKITPPDGESLKKMEKVKNFFYSVGESANNAYKKVFKRGEAKVETKPETK